MIAPKPAMRPMPTGLLAGLVLLLCSVFMFADADVPPVVVWDESRLAVNALEMHLRGFSLVTTYGFSPDLWNTKPPLMIWLMAASASVFGPSELAFRLPAMLSGIGTLAIVFAFTYRITRARWPAVVAVVLLAASVGFYGEHGARTADYDALLCLFTTGYASVFFFAVHQRRPSWQVLLFAAALVAGATMTKSIAGILPGVGIALYAVVTRRFSRVVSNPRYFIAILLALTPVAAFLIARERAASGYLPAVWYNDVGGRYSTVLAHRDGPLWFYFQTVFLDGFFVTGALALFVPFGLITAKGATKSAILFSLCYVFGLMTVYSVSATKLTQYILPALPWISISCALAASSILPRLLSKKQTRSQRLRNVAITMFFGLSLINVGAHAFRMRYVLMPGWQNYPQAGYGSLLAAIHKQGETRVLIVEPGMEIEGVSAYSPQLDYYTRIWSGRGMRIERASTIPARSSAPIASCNPAVVKVLLAAGGTSIAFPGCGMVNLLGQIAARRAGR